MESSKEICEVTSSKEMMYRYNQWLHIMKDVVKHHSFFPEGETSTTATPSEVTDNAAELSEYIPLDVRFMLHTHMLHPRQ